MMNWNELISTRRLGSNSVTQEERYNRTQFQRDYDRLIFSSPFRRMQNKTQVFPLPGSVFVHNRLTHSLEVACVGRTLGTILGDYLISEGEANPLLNELGAVVSAACLAHDMGNPPFGHAGEEAISKYFTEGNGAEIINSKLNLSDKEKSDFIQFDGNANALRLLSHQFKGRREGGYALTYTTLASIVKYPYESISTDKQKFGFFQSEKQLFVEISKELGIIQLNNNPNKFVRHPLVFLVEAADDICYQVMDIEDAFKLNILSYEETIKLFRAFFDEKEEQETLRKIDNNIKIVTDPNEQVAYLRASIINKLVSECFESYKKNIPKILSGEFNTPLIKLIGGACKSAMKEVQEVSVLKIYKHRTVVEIELAGYKIIGTLLDEFLDAVINPTTKYSKMLLSLMPVQYRNEGHTDYEKVLSVIDYVSGMTDVYALDLYRKIKGISLPGIDV